MDKVNYINKYKTLAYDTGLAFGIPPSIVLAVSILETGWGESELAKNYNNFFGIKCHNYHNCIYLYNSEWRKYFSPDQSFSDFGLFLKDNQRYSNCFNYGLLDYNSWADCLQNSGYAGNSTTYANKLKVIIDKENLHELDAEANAEILAYADYKPWLWVLVGIISVGIIFKK